MPADISKVFKASVKAVRMSLEDTQEKNDLLNEELLGKKRKTEQQTKSKNPAEKLTSAIAKELRSIVSVVLWIVILYFDMFNQVISRLKINFRSKI